MRLSASLVLMTGMAAFGACAGGASPQGPLPVSEFPVFLRCKLTVTMPRPSSLTSIVTAVGKDWVFDRRFSELAGVARAVRTAIEPELTISGTSESKPSRTFSAVIVPDEEQGRIAIDWRTTEAVPSGGAIIYSSGVGECRDQASRGSKDKTS